MSFDLMAPFMFAGLVVFLLLGYPVAFSLAANGLLFALIGIAHGTLEPALLQALPERVRHSERVLLGRRLDEPLSLDGLADAVDAEALERLERLGLIRRAADGAALALTERGRFLGGGVTASLLA